MMKMTIILTNIKTIKITIKITITITINQGNKNIKMKNMNKGQIEIIKWKTVNINLKGTTLLYKIMK
jgi:hypothetical protein